MTPKQYISQVVYGLPYRSYNYQYINYNRTNIFKAIILNIWYCRYIPCNKIMMRHNLLNLWHNIFPFKVVVINYQSSHWGIARELYKKVKVNGKRIPLKMWTDAIKFEEEITKL